MTIEILRPGMFTTIQDRGRYGYRRDGVVTAGAMDGWAWKIANALVGNLKLHPPAAMPHTQESNLATLEFFLVGASILFHEQSTIAIFGGQWNITCDHNETQLNKVLPISSTLTGRPIVVPAGTVLDIQNANAGCWGYLAIRGGIDVPKVLNSRSTHVRSRMGGFHGNCLATGDRLRVPGNQAETRPPFHAWIGHRLSYVPWNSAIYDAAAASPREAESDVSTIRFVPGTHWDSLSPDSRRLFLESVWMVTKQSDRMGYRLTIQDQTTLRAPSSDSHSNNSNDRDNAQKLRLSSPFEMLSEPTIHGTIQLPPSGEPIVLMADAATTGGYPRIGYVSKIDIDYLAQHRPGECIRFEKITSEESFQLLQTRAKTSRRLMQGILFQQDSKEP